MIIEMDFMRFQDKTKVRAATIEYLVALESAAVEAEEVLLSNPKLPAVYESGVALRKYTVVKHHQIVNPAEAYRDGYAGVDALSCWRAAELRRGEQFAQLIVRVQSWGVRGAGVLIGVKRASGKIEWAHEYCRRDEKSHITENWP